MPAIVAEGLERAFGEVLAVQGIEISVEESEIFGFLGPNGAGKTTTVRMLTTLLLPTGGSASVAGHDVRSEARAVRASIGVALQEAALDPLMTGRELIRLQATLQGIPTAEGRKRADDLLERVGLDHAADRRVGTYSGGMQRRLDVAIGLIHTPSVLFLDEPTTGLDPEARADMWQQIELLRDEQRMTILLTTHYLEEADRLAAEVAIVDRGRIVVQGAPGRLKSDLQGDTLEVELAADGDARLEGALSGVEGIDLVTHERGTLRARARDGAASIPAVLAALEARGLAARSVTVARPSLDEVYLRHVGRSFAEVAA